MSAGDEMEGEQGEIADMRLQAREKWSGDSDIQIPERRPDQDE